MNKIAVYLNEHLLGEVSSAKSIRKKYATDGSILSISPEIVAFPKVTNDIRKIARFTWQLAEKGHIVGMTARGFGNDVTGAAIGRGIIIDTSRQFNKIIQLAAKDKLVQVEAGASVSTVNEVLKWQGLYIPGASQRNGRLMSVAGAIANDSIGLDGKSLADAVEKLEVVLANGDVLETGTVSKRDVNKKLGLQTLEGEIYRKLEALFEDNEEVIKQITEDTARENTGYKRITDIRSKDGSYNLTPLFIGSQGTLGIISEIVLKADFYTASETYAAIATDSIQTARDLGERIAELDPSEVTIYDGALFRRAVKQGSKFAILEDIDTIGAVVFVRFNDSNDRVQLHKLKKLRKLLRKMDIGMVDSTERDTEDFVAIADVNKTIQLSAIDDHATLPIIDGAWVPTNRREEFEVALNELASKHHTELPVELNVLNNIYSVYPTLKLSTVGDKQKVFKIMTDYAAIVDRCDGSLTADGAEGRVKAPAAWSILDEKHADLYNQVRQIFDPLGTLNPEVKQDGELRGLIAALRTDFDSSSVL
ncbi:MAG: FAD-binding oxidoreductase [Candidatus Microsaccharimonas sp.]